MVVNGDTYIGFNRSTIDPNPFLSNSNIILCVNYHDASRYGKVIVNNLDSSVISFAEKDNHEDFPRLF